MTISKIVIHCSATQNGRALGSATQTAAERIDAWHAQRGFKRSAQAVRESNTHLKHVGYHYIIDTDGVIETGRAVGETGAHVKGHNTGSIGICLVGGITADKRNHGEYTVAQWRSLHQLVTRLKVHFPKAKFYGHRDLSPDTNGNGKIEKHEWLKACPCFDVQQWLTSGEVVNQAHLFKE